MSLAGEGQQHKYTMGLASVAADMCGQDGIPLSTLDSQMCGHSSVFCSLEMSVTLSFIKE